MAFLRIAAGARQGSTFVADLYVVTTRTVFGWSSTPRQGPRRRQCARCPWPAPVGSWSCGRLWWHNLTSRRRWPPSRYCRRPVREAALIS